MTFLFMVIVVMTFLFMVIVVMAFLFMVMTAGSALSMWTLVKLKPKKKQE